MNVDYNQYIKDNSNNYVNNIFNIKCEKRNMDYKIYELKNRIKVLENLSKK